MREASANPTSAEHIKEKTNGWFCTKTKHSKLIL
jgi:hypothetical protein